MPWTPKQHRLFEAAAHDPSVAKAVKIPMSKAVQMASEGVKDGAKTMQPSRPAKSPASPQALARALHKMKGKI